MNYDDFAISTTRDHKSKWSTQRAWDAAEDSLAKTQAELRSVMATIDQARDSLREFRRSLDKVFRRANG